MPHISLIMSYKVHIHTYFFCQRKVFIFVAHALFIISKWGKVGGSGAEWIYKK